MVTYEKMYQAYLDCRKHKQQKYGTKRFESNALFNVAKLTDEINQRKYKLKPSQCFIIKYPTTREVFCANFRDRVVQHYVFNELNPIIDKMLIYDTASCRKNKGTDFAIKRVGKFVRKETNNYHNEAFFLKMDLSGFFMKIDRQRLMNLITNIINEKYSGNKEDILYLCKIIILSDVTKNAIRLCKQEEWDKLPQRKTLFNNPFGLPIGNICSQLFANLYLNDFDHIMKSRHKCYERYVDDMVIVDKDKNKLIESLNIAKSYFPAINMVINENKTKISNCKYGIRFLGIVTKPYYQIVGKQRINRLFYASKLYKNAEDAKKRTASRAGAFQHYSGYKIFHRWFNQMPSDITDNLVLIRWKLFLLNENTKI